MSIEKSAISGIYSAFPRPLSALRRRLMESLSGRVTRLSRTQLIRLVTVLLLASGMALPLAAQGVTAVNGVWLKVDTQEATLTVMNGDQAQKVFKGIAIGRYGTTDVKMQGDHRTPLGSFTIGWIPEKSRYHRFLGLTYPDIERADRALAEGGDHRSTVARHPSRLRNERAPRPKTPRSVASSASMVRVPGMPRYTSNTTGPTAVLH
jgi:hypothetical protein